MTDFDRAQAQAHLEALAGAHDIDIEWVSGVNKAYADPNHRPVVYTPKPTTLWRYLVGLHELGHVIDPDSRKLAWSNRPGADVARESWAWTWAFAHVRKPWRSLVEPKHRRRAGAYWSTFLG